MKVERKSLRERHVYQIANLSPEGTVPEDANMTTGV